MPRPNKPWVAVDFDAMATHVALIRENSDEIVSFSFPNLFVFNKQEETVTFCADVDELTADEGDEIFFLHLSKIKPNGFVNIANSDLTYPFEKLLKQIFVYIKKECEARYFDGRSLELCYLVTRNSAKHSATKLFDALKNAAIEAGIAEVECRKRNEVVMNALADERPFENNVVLCEVSYNYISLSCLKRSGDGYLDSLFTTSPDHLYLGLNFVASRLADAYYKSYSDGGENNTISSLKKEPFKYSIANVLSAYPADSAQYSVLFDGKVRVFTGEVVKKIASSLADYLEKEIFQSYFDGVPCHLQGAPYEVVLVGPGSGFTELRKKLEKVADSSAMVTVVGAQNGAEAWAQNILMMEETPSYRSSPRRSAYLKLLKSANSGDSTACLDVSNCLANGLGTICCYEEAFYWVQKAAESGEPNALYQLGKCYEGGWGSSRDQSKARAAFLQAAQAGHAKAQYKIGSSLLKAGKKEQGLHWLSLAAEQGVEKAKRLLERNNLPVVTELVRPIAEEEAARTSKEHIVGLFVSALVFAVGGMAILGGYDQGAAQKQAASIAYWISIATAMILSIVACVWIVELLLKKRA